MWCCGEQLDYDGQRKRTKVKSKDLDPKWNEKVVYSLLYALLVVQLEVVSII